MDLQRVHLRRNQRSRWPGGERPGWPGAALASAALLGMMAGMSQAKGPSDLRAAARPGAATPVAAARATVGVDDFLARGFDDGRGHRLPYRLFVPRSRAARAGLGGGPSAGGAGKGVVATTARPRYPLVVFLHGAGGRGSDNRGQLADQDAALVFVRPENQARWPVFMVAPQCPVDQQWVDMPWGTSSGRGMQPKTATWPMTATLNLVDKLLRDHPDIDPTRVYLTGISMGGFGTWDALVRAPTRWRAAVAVCGGYDELVVGPLARARVPVWAFHAADDPTVPVERSRALVAALRAAGASPRYTEYPAAAHHGHESWRPAYADPDLLPWLFGPAAAAADPGRGAARNLESDRR